MTNDVIFLSGVILICILILFILRYCDPKRTKSHLDPEWFALDGPPPEQQFVKYTMNKKRSLDEISERGKKRAEKEIKKLKTTPEFIKWEESCRKYKLGEFIVLIFLINFAFSSSRSNLINLDFKDTINIDKIKTFVIDMIMFKMNNILILIISMIIITSLSLFFFYKSILFIGFVLISEMYEHIIIMYLSALEIKIVLIASLLIIPGYYFYPQKKKIFIGIMIFISLLVSSHYVDTQWLLSLCYGLMIYLIIDDFLTTNIQTTVAFSFIVVLSSMAIYYIVYYYKTEYIKLLIILAVIISVLIGWGISMITGKIIETILKSFIFSYFISVNFREISILDLTLLIISVRWFLF